MPIMVFIILNILYRDPMECLLLCHQEGSWWQQPPLIWNGWKKLSSKELGFFFVSLLQGFVRTIDSCHGK